VGFDHQYVAIGQRIRLARVDQAGCQRAYLKAGRDVRRLARFPADRLRDMHRRDEILMGGGQHGVGADLAVPIERRARIGAACECQKRGAGKCGMECRAHQRASPVSSLCESAPAKAAVTIIASTVSAESASPVGTTEVQASRLCTKLLKSERIRT